MGKNNSHDDVHDKGRKGDKHRKSKRSHQERPCPNPPAAPTGVALTFKVREKKNRLEYSGKVKWNQVTQDEQGHKIPGGGVEIDHYEGKFWPTDAAGVAIETEDGSPRVRRFHRKSIKGVKVIKAQATGTAQLAEYTTKKAHGLVAAEEIRVQDIKPAAYNGKFTVASVVSATVFRANIGQAVPSNANGKLDSEGTVEGEPDPSYNFIIEHISNPKRWYWKAAVRAWDNKNCPSDWNEVGPLLPAAEAEPKPPAPGFVSLTFDRRGVNKHDAFRGKIRIDPIRSWDIPGGDHEDDLASYHAKIEVSDDAGASWQKHAHISVKDSDDEKDEGTNILMIFHRARRGNKYRVWLKSTSRYHQKGDYAGPYPNSNGKSPGDDIAAPNKVRNVTVLPKGPRRLVASWDEPFDAEDVDTYKIEWWRRNPLTLMETNRSRNRNDVYRVPEADKGKAHFPIVYAMDHDDVQGPANDALLDTSETGEFPGGAPDPGTIRKWGGRLANVPGIGGTAPVPWLVCNGQVVGRSTYSVLFGVVGTDWGPGDGTTTFNVPDARKRHWRGAGTGDTQGQTEGQTEANRNPDHGNHDNGPHGQHRPHRHRHKHRHKNDNHDQHGGTTADDTGGHTHGLSQAAGSYTITSTDTAIQATSPAGSTNYARQAHNHWLAGNTGGQGSRHTHPAHGSIKGDSATDPAGHVVHGDNSIAPDGPADLYVDSQVGDGTNYLGTPTDGVGLAITVDESLSVATAGFGHAAHPDPVDADRPNNRGHRPHPHNKVHYIIKT